MVLPEPEPGVARVPVLVPASEPVPKPGLGPEPEPEPGSEPAPEPGAEPELTQRRPRPSPPQPP